MGAPTKPRKAAAKKTPTPAGVSPVTAEELDRLQAELDEQVPVDAEGNIRPVQIGKRGRKAPEMVTIFEIDGVEYQIPKHPSPALLIRFMREARDKRVGVDVATANLLTSLLGETALDALADSPDVSEEDVADVMAIVTHIAFGGVKRLRETSGN